MSFIQENLPKKKGLRICKHGSKRLLRVKPIDTSNGQSRLFVCRHVVVESQFFPFDIWSLVVFFSARWCGVFIWIRMELRAVSSWPQQQKSFIEFCLKGCFSFSNYYVDKKTAVMGNSSTKSSAKKVAKFEDGNFRHANFIEHSQMETEVWISKKGWLRVAYMMFRNVIFIHFSKVSLLLHNLR